MQAGRASQNSASWQFDGHPFCFPNCTQECQFCIPRISIVGSAPRPKYARTCISSIVEDAETVITMSCSLPCVEIRHVGGGKQWCIWIMLAVNSICSRCWICYVFILAFGAMHTPCSRGARECLILHWKSNCHPRHWWKWC